MKFLLLFSIFSVVFATTVFANENTLRLTQDSLTYTLNGETGTLDVAPINIRGRTLIPFRFIGEAMGATVTHTPATETTPLIAHFYLDGIEIDIIMGTAIYHDDVNIGMANIVDGRTLVPVRVAEMMGATVEWEPVTRSIYIIFTSE